MARGGINAVEIGLAPSPRNGVAAGRTIPSTCLRGSTESPPADFRTTSMSTTALRASTPRFSPVQMASTASPAAAVASQLRTAAAKAPAAVGSRAAAQVPWAFRGGPETEIGKTIQGMVDRARQFDVKLGNDSVERMLTEGLLKNPKVTNDMLMQISRLSLEQLAESPEDVAEIERRVPGSRDLPSHKFTVGLLSALTGVDSRQLSERTPGLGVTGAPGTPILFAPKRTGLQRSTALHDTTDYLRGAGVQGLNKAVWGVENRVISAFISLFGVRY
jgi:hypothetical protein